MYYIRLKVNLTVVELQYIFKYNLFYYQPPLQINIFTMEFKPYCCCIKIEFTIEMYIFFCFAAIHFINSASRIVDIERNGMQ